MSSVPSWHAFAEVDRVSPEEAARIAGRAQKTVLKEAARPSSALLAAAALPVVVLWEGTDPVLPVLEAISPVIEAAQDELGPGRLRLKGARIGAVAGFHSLRRMAGLPDVPTAGSWIGAALEATLAGEVQPNVAYQNELASVAAAWGHWEMVDRLAAPGTEAAAAMKRLVAAKAAGDQAEAQSAFFLAVGLFPALSEAGELSHIGLLQLALAYAAGIQGRPSADAVPALRKFVLSLV